MKIAYALLLTILLAGCAPGYYNQRPAYQEEETTKLYDAKMYQNPETEAEQAQRIWRMESHP
jgi:hypothetical protein